MPSFPKRSLGKQLLVSLKFPLIGKLRHNTFFFYISIANIPFLTDIDIGHGFDLQDIDIGWHLEGNEVGTQGVRVAPDARWHICNNSTDQE